MNKSYLNSVLGCLMLLLSSVALAELKLGYVNAALLLDRSPQAQKATSELKKEFSGRESDMIAANNEVIKMKKKLDRDGSIMSESKRKKLQVKILSHQRNLMRKDEALRQDVTIRRNEIMASLQILIRTAIDKVGNNGNYDIVFYEGIAYANPDLDISDLILDELKKLDRMNK